MLDNGILSIDDIENNRNIATETIKSIDNIR